MLRVLVIARTPERRAQLRGLASRPDVRVIGEARTLTDPAIDGASYDVAVVDGRDITDLSAAGIADRLPGVVLVGGSPDAARLARSSGDGWAVLLADATANEIHAAVLAVAEGLVALAPEIANQLAGDAESRSVGDSGDGPNEEGVRREGLTPRELDVLGLLAEGLSNKQIAGALEIGDQTVKFHLSSIYAKLGVNSRAAAIRAGLRSGLIQL